jgi:hypothetical protein
MKKKKIALAAISAVGAASAQVSITGTVAYGWSSSTNSDGVTSSGLGQDTGYLKFAASEDLGNGMKAAGSLTINTNNHGAGATADDQAISLSTPVATIALGQNKSAEWTSAAAGSGALIGLDSAFSATNNSKVAGARAPRDYISVSVPLATGLTSAFGYQEPVDSTSVAVQGLGAGTSGTTRQGLYFVGVGYTAGPATLSAQYLSWTNAGSTDATSNDTTRLGAKVNLGVATVGGGLQIGKQAGGGTNTTASVAVTGSLSDAISLNGLYTTNNQSGSLLTSGRKSGFSIGGAYSFSKRTSLNLGIANWTGGGATQAFDANASSAYEIMLEHNF